MDSINRREFLVRSTQIALTLPFVNFSEERQKLGIGNSKAEKKERNEESEIGIPEDFFGGRIEDYHSVLFEAIELASKEFEDLVLELKRDKKEGRLFSLSEFSILQNNSQLYNKYFSLVEKVESNLASCNSALNVGFPNGSKGDDYKEMVDLYAGSFVCSIMNEFVKAIGKVAELESKIIHLDKCKAYVTEALSWYRNFISNNPGKMKENFRLIVQDQVFWTLDIIESDLYKKRLFNEYFNPENKFKYANDLDFLGRMIIFYGNDEQRRMLKENKPDLSRLREIFIEVVIQGRKKGVLSGPYYLSDIEKLSLDDGIPGYQILEDASTETYWHRYIHRNSQEGRKEIQPKEVVDQSEEKNVYWDFEHKTYLSIFSTSQLGTVAHEAGHRMSKSYPVYHPQNETDFSKRLFNSLEFNKGQFIDRSYFGLVAEKRGYYYHLLYSIYYLYGLPYEAFDDKGPKQEEAIKLLDSLYDEKTGSPKNMLPHITRSFLDYYDIKSVLPNQDENMSKGEALLRFMNLIASNEDEINLVKPKPEYKEMTFREFINLGEVLPMKSHSSPKNNTSLS